MKHEYELISYRLRAGNPQSWKPYSVMLEFTVRTLTSHVIIYQLRAGDPQDTVWAYSVILQITARPLISHLIVFFTWYYCHTITCSLFHLIFFLFGFWVMVLKIVKIDIAQPISYNYNVHWATWIIFCLQIVMDMIHDAHVK